jgi:hypothetical protein
MRIVMFRAAVNNRVKEVMQTAVGPAVVAETVLKAARAANPDIRYTAGGLAGCLRMPRGFVPAGVMDAGISKEPAARRKPHCELNLAVLTF